MDSSTDNLWPAEYALPFVISEVEQTDNWLQLKFRVFAKRNTTFATQPKFIINNSVVFEMAMFCDIFNDTICKFYVQFSEIGGNQKIAKFNYNMLLENNVLEKYFSANCNWHLIDTFKCQKLEEFVISVTLYDAPLSLPVPVSRQLSLPVLVSKQDTLDKTCPNCSKHVYTPSASPQDDTVMPDVTYIELLGKDGSVHLHKVIAATSPFPFSGNRQGTAKCVVNIPGTIRVTLQHLKESIIYSNTLPGTDFEELLILASYNTMSELELRCVDALSMSITPNIAYNLTEFAGKYNIQELLYKLKKNVQDDILKLDQISEYVASNLKLFEIK